MPSQADAERFLRDRYGDRAGAVTPLGAGEWSRVYAVALDGRDMAVKFGAYADDIAKDVRMARHSSGSLPIPAVHDSGPALGGFFAVQQRVHGDFLDELDETGMRLVLPGLLTALHAARSIEIARPDSPAPDGPIPDGPIPDGPGPDGSGPDGPARDGPARDGSGPDGPGGHRLAGYGPWRPDGTAVHHSWRDALLDVVNDRPGGRTHGWRHALASSPTGAGPFDAAAEALGELAPRGPQPRQLIHGDLLYRNVLVQGPLITAVLDWGNSMYGDGLYDLAWLLYWWPWFPAWRDIDVRAIIADDLEASGEWPADAARRLRCYQIHIGLDAQAYNAFTGRWQELADNARLTAALAERA
jgi:hygromycin-B 4-O-kinase